MKLRDITPTLKASAGAPEHRCRKALEQIERFNSGERNYTRLQDRGCGYIKINIGPAWRLLSRNAGKTWSLLTHEQYNGISNK